MGVIWACADSGRTTDRATQNFNANRIPFSGQQKSVRRGQTAHRNCINTSNANIRDLGHASEVNQKYTSKVQTPPRGLWLRPSNRLGTAECANPFLILRWDCHGHLLNRGWP